MPLPTHRILPLLLLGGLLSSGDLAASDHLDGPQAAGDPAADLGDLYAWKTDDDTLAIVLTYGGPLEAGAPPLYDDDVLYSVHFDRDGDFQPDTSLWIRFGQSDAGNWGVRVENVPGTDGALEGPADTVIYGGVVTRAWAGLADDPFFFDLDGWQMTLDNIAMNPNGANNLAFDDTRDTFAGLNTMAIVVEMPLADALDGAAGIDIWATTGRR